LTKFKRKIQGENNSDPVPDQDLSEDLDPFLGSGSLLGS
jgi:hypothetical protein